MANFSSRRQAVLEVMQKMRCHPSADMVYEECRKTIPNISLATVYRNLAFYEKQGLVGRVVGCDNKERYDVEMDTHCHIICTKCGEVMYMDYPQKLKQYLDDYCKQEGFSKFGLSFYGLCDNCKSNQNGNDNLKEL